MKPCLCSPSLLHPTYYDHKGEEKKGLRKTTYSFFFPTQSFQKISQFAPVNIKMNDLFSRSLREYLADDKCQIHAIDIEAGWGEEKETIDLDKFFEDVEKVEEDMKDVYRLYKNLRDSNEESKTVHKAKSMKEVRARMDSDVGQVLKRVKVIKGKLEALDRANVTHRSLPGCGPRSSVDRARTSVVSGLGKKLRVMLDEFQALRTKISSEYKETIAKRYFIVTGEKANEKMIEILISTGESETFLQKVIQEQARGKILDTISEFQERHDTVKEIEMNLNELHQMFLDVAVLVEAQGGQVEDIESHLAHASSYVRHAADKIQVAREDQKSSRKWGCIAILLGACVLALVILPVLSAVLVHVL